MVAGENQLLHAISDLHNCIVACTPTTETQCNINCAVFGFDFYIILRIEGGHDNQKHKETCFSGVDTRLNHLAFHLIFVEDPKELIFHTMLSGNCGLGRISDCLWAFRSAKSALIDKATLM